MLKDRWLELSDEEKTVWREWTEWDKKRYSRDLYIFENRRSEDDSALPQDTDDMKSIHVPKKRKVPLESSSELTAVPKKKKK